MELQDLLQHYAAIIESSDDAIISKTLGGIITSWNPAAERIFGYTANEAIGKSILIIFPPGHANEEYEILGRIANGKKIEHQEVRRVRKDGTMIDVSVTISPIKDPRGKIIGASKIARDITEMKEVRESLNQALRRYKLTLDNMLEGVQVVGNDMLILYANQAAAKFAGHPAAVLLGQKVGEAYSQFDSSRVVSAIRRCLNDHAHQRFEFQFEYGDGRSAKFDVRVEPVPDGALILSMEKE